MNSVSAESLRPGQRVRITCVREGTVASSSRGVHGRFQGHTVRLTVGDPVFVADGDPCCVIDVLKAPLPTAIGTRILAEVSGFTTPIVLTMTRVDGLDRWCVAGSPYGTSEITDWRILDGLDTRNPNG